MLKTHRMADCMHLPQQSSSSWVWEPKSNVVHFSLKYDNGDNNFWATVSKTVRRMLSDRSLSCLSVTLVYCGQKVGWIKIKLGMEVGLGPGHIVLDRGRAPPPLKGHSPQFSMATLC